MQVVQTAIFSSWLSKQTDIAAARIVARVRRLELGNPGDIKSVGGGVIEMRINYGPGYRVYYVQRGKKVILLLCGGDKRTQTQDIKTAQQMAKEV